MNPPAVPVLLLACLAAPPAAGAQAASDQALIRQARAASNQAIARHDVPGVLAFLADEFQVSASNGSFMRRKEMGDAFTGRFAEFRDAVYVRTPETVEVNPAGTVAAETGTWTGSWTTPGGPFRTGGRYAASWRKVDGKWLIHSELFVPLFCAGPGCP